MLFLFNILSLAAQEDSIEPVVNNYITDRPDKAQRRFLRALSLTDTASGMLISNKGDTTRAIIYLAGRNVTPRMQSYIVAEDSSGRLSFYNPVSIREYIVNMPEGGIQKFISVNNNLNIVSVVSPSMATGIREGHYQEEPVLGTRIFLHCLIDGHCRLYKYNTGTGKEDLLINNGEAITPATVTVRERTATRYCIQKDNGRLIEINAQSIANAFGDCSGVKELAVPATLKDQSQMRLLVGSYNKCAFVHISHLLFPHLSI